MVLTGNMHSIFFPGYVTYACATHDNHKCSCRMLGSISQNFKSKLWSFQCVSAGSVLHPADSLKERTMFEHKLVVLIVE